MMYDEKDIEGGLNFDNLKAICSQLTKEIKGIFEGTGMYFQILSRVKEAKSIASKLATGNYENDGKKIQDLIGIRIVLYYFDDINISKEILEHIFNRVDEWSESNNDVDEFKATKRNGVFKIPKEFMSLYIEEYWELPIDRTFEIQLRTMSFEGWHEIEHDMRYKKNEDIGDLWQDNYSLSRMMNCVLANLELCDWSLVNVFDKLAHNHLETGKLELMIKSRFRLRMKDEPLNPEIAEVFAQRPQLAKKFYDCSRQQLIEELLKHEKPVITPSYIIRMLNEAVVKDAQIESACDGIKWKKSEKVQVRSGCKKVTGHPAFNYDVILGRDSDRSLDEEWAGVADVLYGWAYDMFGNVFEMPEETCDFQSETPGYKLSVKLNRAKYKINVYAMYIDLDRTGTMWNVHTECTELDGKLHFTVRVECDSVHVIPEQELFRKPYFIKEMNTKFGFVDIIKLNGEIHRIKTSEELENMKKFVDNIKRKMPVVVVCQDGMEEDKALIKMSGLSKAIDDYAHLFFAGAEVFEGLAEFAVRKADELDGSVILFWRKDAKMRMSFYSRQQVLNSQFDFNRFVYSNGQIYDKAFRRKILQIIKTHNRTDG